MSRDSALLDIRPQLAKVVLRPREFAIRKQPFICEIRQSPKVEISVSKLIELNVIIEISSFVFKPGHIICRIDGFQLDR
jgi:hypothetical protein